MRFGGGYYGTILSLQEFTAFRMRGNENGVVDDEG